MASPTPTASLDLQVEDCMRKLRADQIIYSEQQALLEEARQQHDKMKKELDAPKKELQALQKECKVHEDQSRSFEKERDSIREKIIQEREAHEQQLGASEANVKKLLTYTYTLTDGHQKERMLWDKQLQGLEKVIQRKEDYEQAMEAYYKNELAMERLKTSTTQRQGGDI